MLVFAILYSPVESVGTGLSYELCEDCVKSACYLDRKTPCIWLGTYDVDYNFTCYMCDCENGNQQFYSEDECKKGCTDPSKMCICDAPCYMFNIVKQGADLFNFMDCTLPEKKEEPTSE
ncbi:unnamed protein product [Macrosiphum euphorbiae]|uniref:Uncharacterized protein n=1 Tax=Macrosiphum euphorbiae TaxID=13131 RepID=A0AAV0XNL5_9HEMI|nr:unnamed protein product [Macrosiphum euphorbiae]